MSNYSEDSTSYPEESLRAELTHDHRQIDIPIAAFAEGSDERDVEALKQAMHDLRSHIYMEEEQLFPPLAQVGNQMPVFVMIREHAVIWNLLDKLDEALAPHTGGTQAFVQELCIQLAETLQIHNVKEEQILYSLADDILNSGQAGIVSSLLDTHVLPEDWVPQGLR